MIITISRETGSGGHTIGKMLAERLGYDFYDKELIPLVAKNMEHRIARVQRHDGITGEDNRIRRELEVKDHSRGMLYQFFTGREWGRVANYHLSIDTSVFTKTQATEIILNALEKYNGGKNNA